MSGAARFALATAWARATDDAIADAPLRDRVADGHDRAAPLVALDRSATTPTVDHHVEVAPAHTAVTDLGEHLLGPDARHGHLFDGQLALALQDDRRHRL